MARLIRKAKTFLRDVKKRGIATSIRSAFARAAVALLGRVFSFPSAWHNPTIDRPYRLAIADAVNRRRPAAVCEVGCGLGSILGRIEAKYRLGFDIDPGVIAAARLRWPRGIDFKVGGLENAVVPKADFLILVNWIHDVSPDTLAEQLTRLLGCFRFLIVDAIDDGQAGYAYHHDFAFLQGRARLIERIRCDAEARDFLVYEIAG